GPLAEQELRRAMTISNGDASVFITQPLAAALLFLAGAAVVGPKLYQFTRRQTPRPENVPGDA
ncbi:MAG: tripartite tricarboxylate transporter permease, partial [Alsobacter sp.]